MAHISKFGIFLLEDSTGKYVGARARVRVREAGKDTTETYEFRFPYEDFRSALLMGHGSPERAARALQGMIGKPLHPAFAEGMCERCPTMRAFARLALRRRGRKVVTWLPRRKRR